MKVSITSPRQQPEPAAELGRGAGSWSRLSENSRKGTDSNRAGALLRAITEGTAAATGDKFFRSLVEHAATALEVRFCFVAECLPNRRARSLAWWLDGKLGENFEYALPGTPCMHVAEGRTCHYPDRIPELFPEDTAMIQLGTVSYLGVPLRDSGQRVIGHLVVFDDKPMPSEPLALSVMETFAARAVADEREHRQQCGGRETEPERPDESRAPQARRARRRPQHHRHEQRLQHDLEARRAECRRQRQRRPGHGTPARLERAREPEHDQRRPRDRLRVDAAAP